MRKEDNTMQKIISLSKRRGFIFPSSEIYGGLEGFWDYGPLGSLLKNNIKKLWLENFVQKRKDIVLIDGSVIMSSKVWQASGHLSAGFSDELVECKKCQKRFRFDHLEELKGTKFEKTWRKCPECGEIIKEVPRKFNLMLKTFVGSIENDASRSYLRPETAQSMFTNFKNILNSSRVKLPFGIAQIGKSFRNEINTSNFIFRSREFEIAEIEYFINPENDERFFDLWLKEWENFVLKIDVRKGNLRRKEHKKEDLAHYSKRTVDIEYNFPFGWSELAGVANRTDFDLKQHSEFSGENLKYQDDETKKEFFPYVIEPTIGIDRLFLTILIDAYSEISGGREGEKRNTKQEAEVVLKLNKKLAPITVAVLPLVKNKKEITKKSEKVFDLLRNYFTTQYDETGSIGRRYRRQDEIGTPYCITIDFDTLKDDTVTLRDRNTMEQERIKVDELPGKIQKYLND